MDHPEVKVNATTTQRLFEFLATVPDVLPEGETPETVDEIGRGQLVKQASQAGFQIDPSSYAAEDTGPAPDGRVRRWSAIGVRVEAPSEIPVQAQLRVDGAWQASLPAPHVGGMYSVKHGLGTEAVIVECQRADGSPIGYVEWVPIAEDDVTVIAVPDTATIVLRAAPEEPESDAQEQPGA